MLKIGDFVRVVNFDSIYNECDLQLVPEIEAFAWSI